MPRLTTELSGGAMADIAFLLLLFFMVSTTIEKEQGIAVTLPKWEENTISSPTSNQQISIKLNSNSDVMIQGDALQFNQISNRLIDIFSQVSNNQKFPIISFASSDQASYHKYLKVYDEIKIAFRQYWSVKGIEIYNKQWNRLTKSEQSKIKSKWKMVVSEAEITY